MGATAFAVTLAPGGGPDRDLGHGARAGLALARPEERVWLSNLPEGEALGAAKVVFSAKEAAYKPCTR